MSEQFPVLIVGSGALALLFGAWLGAAGYPVTLLGSWRQGVEAVRERGIYLWSGECRLHVPARAVFTPQEAGPVRWALVLVKSWQTERAAYQLRECLSEDGLALTLQNGLGNREILERVLGKARVAQGVTTYGATLIGPGEARLGGQGAIFLAEHPRLEAFFHAFRQAGLQVEQSERLETMIWGKLVINSAINPLTAVLNVPNGELLARPGARALLGALAEETAAIARALGIPLPFAEARAAAEAVAQQTAQNLSSMLQDVRRGAPTEIDAICGAIFAEAQKRGVPAPLNWTMWHLVRALASPPPPSGEMPQVQQPAPGPR